MLTIKERQKHKRYTYTKDEIARYKRHLRVYKNLLKSGWENKPYNEFLDIVKDRVDPTLDKDNKVCPFCNSTNISVLVWHSTAVGSGPGEDCNHHWESCICGGCANAFVYEYKGHGSKEADGKKVPNYNVWITKERKILKGMPTCFERYIYTCSKCGGDVNVTDYDKGTKNVARCLGTSLNEDTGIYENQYDTYYKCFCCGVEVKSSTEYYSFSNPHRPCKPFKNRLRLGWTIKEEIGEVWINDYVLDTIDLEVKDGN